MDPPGALAQKLLLHLDFLGLTNRVIYDRLSDTDLVPCYDWLVPSTHSDVFQRRAENDESIREFAAVLLRRRGLQDIAANPVIEDSLLAALRLYVHQASPVPLVWLSDVFRVGSEAHAHLVEHCTESELAWKFQEYAALSPSARRRELGPAERILRAVCLSPAFQVRSGEATFNLTRFLDDKGILIFDGSSHGNLSRDAAAIMMGAIILRIIQHCRTGAKSKVVLVLDEAVNADLIGLHESQALAEAGKWGLEFHILVQNPFLFPSEEIRSNVLQNTWRHEWFRQGSPQAAKFAAEDIATPLLDLYQVHHTEYRTRTKDIGFERVPTTSRTESVDPRGVRHRSTNWSTVLWPRRKEVQEAQVHYTGLRDQGLLLQKQLMLLEPGYRFVRSDRVTPAPEYVTMLKDPWSTFGSSDDAAAKTFGNGLVRFKFREALRIVKTRPMFRAPSLERSSPSREAAGAAQKLSVGV